MKHRFLLAGSVAALALALISAMPWQTSWAKPIGATPSPKPSPTPVKTPASPYVIARNPFILDSVAVAGPGRGEVAGSDAHLIGVVLGAHPGAIFSDKAGKAVTLSIGDKLGQLSIRQISMQGVTLSDGSQIQVAQDTTSYGVDQSVGPTMPPIGGYSSQQVLTGMPAPQFPLQATPVPQNQGNPWGASPYGSSPYNNSSPGSNPYNTGGAGNSPYQSSPSASPNPLFQQ